ncbi:MAG TPA: hypothetical protein VG935_04815 [Patescibacteria group bacterium]|nr:hypothetical protein [Patescibacteria group bacterium]
MADAQDFIKNPIKNNILKMLMINKRQKYSEMMLEETDNVLFNYHLQHLVKLGYVQKHDNYYSLTPEGVQLTANITEGGLYFPKFINAYKMYLVQDDKVLLQYCNHRPWFGNTEPLTSKVLYGTATEARATVRMQEKIGVKADMKWIGTLRTRVLTPEQELLDDAFHMIMYADKYEGEVKKLDDSKHPLTWYSFDEAIEFETNNKGAGEKSVEILKRLKECNYTPFLFDEVAITKAENCFRKTD